MGTWSRFGHTHHSEDLEDTFNPLEQLWTMEITMSSRLGHNGYSKQNTSHELAPFWRPWTQGQLELSMNFHMTRGNSLVESTDDKKPNECVHPVKLFWPRSRCYDYLYQDAEALLQNYPVQATICLYADSSSDEDSDEEDEKEMN